MMNTGEGALAEITAAFCLTVNGISRKGDTWQITTDDEEVQLKEYQGNIPKLQERLSWYNYLRENGVSGVAKLLSTKENELIKTAGSTAYFGWYLPKGEAFSGQNEQHLAAGITTLALIHAQTSRYEEGREPEKTEWQLPLQIQTRLTDLLVFSHKMAEKRLADDFQKVFQENFGIIYDQGQEAIQKMIIANTLTSYPVKYIPLIDSFLPEGILLNEGQALFMPSLVWTRGPKVQDLAGFLRNFLGHYSWDPELAYKLIKLYEEHNPLNIAERYLLLSLMRFPARFWLYSCQYQRQEKSTPELTAKLIDLIHEIRVSDHCMDKLDSLLSGGE